MHDFFESYRVALSKWGVTCVGALVGTVDPVLPMALIFTLAVLVDSFTAWRLSRRVRRMHPDANDGKFKSRHFGKVFHTLMLVYTLIWLCHLIQEHIFGGFSVALPNIVAGAACAWQLWSILENESSCNDAGWARFLQRFLVDKASRHFDFDIDKTMREIRDEQIAMRAELKVSQSSGRRRRAGNKRKRSATEGVLSEEKKEEVGQ